MTQFFKYIKGKILLSAKAHQIQFYLLCIFYAQVTQSYFAE